MVSAGIRHPGISLLQQALANFIHPARHMLALPADPLITLHHLVRRRNAHFIHVALNRVIIYLIGSLRVSHGQKAVDLTDLPVVIGINAGGAGVHIIHGIIIIAIPAVLAQPVYAFHIQLL